MTSMIINHSLLLTKRFANYHHVTPNPRLLSSARVFQMLFQLILTFVVQLLGIPKSATQDEIRQVSTRLFLLVQDTNKLLAGLQERITEVRSHNSLFSSVYRSPRTHPDRLVNVTPVEKQKATEKFQVKNSTQSRKNWNTQCCPGRRRCVLRAFGSRPKKRI